MLMSIALFITRRNPEVALYPDRATQNPDRVPVCTPQMSRGFKKPGSTTPPLMSGFGRAPAARQLMKGRSSKARAAAAQKLIEATPSGVNRTESETMQATGGREEKKEATDVTP